MFWRTLRVLALGGAATVLAGCQDFAAIEADGRCGNGVHEPAVGELCDAPPGSEGMDGCGAPGTAAACQRVCAPVSPNATCPPGMACGGDGICRAPSGRFGPPQVLGNAGIGLQTGDVNGDGRRDLLVVEADQTTVAYGDADGRFADRRSIDVTPLGGEVLVGDWDGEPGDDLVFLVSDGALRVRGGETRRLVPEADPLLVIFSESTPALLPVRLPGGELLIVAMRTAAQGYEWARVGEGVVPAWAPVPGGTQLHAPPMGPPIDVSLRVVAVPARNGAGVTETWYAPAARGADRVPLLRLLCDANAESCRFELAATVSLPPGLALLDVGPLSGDWEGDGLPDLVIPVGDREQQTVVVASGEEGGFGPGRRLLELDPLLRCPVCPDMAATLQGVPDLNQDGRADLVLRHEVFVRQGEPAVPQSAYRPDTFWLTVVAADLNGDGRPDLVGSRLDGTELLLANGQGGFFAQPVPAPGHAGTVQVGDFDGDLQLDLALVETGNRVAVIFGKPNGLADERVETLEMSNVSRLVKVPADARGSVLDGLLVLGEGKLGSAAARPLVHLRGDAGRRMRSGVTFDRPPQIGAVGRLDAMGGPAVVVGVERAGDWQFFRLGTRPEEAREARALTLVGDCDFTGLRALSLRALPIEREGRETLLAWRGLNPDERDGRDALPSAWPVWQLTLDGDILRCAALGEVAGGATGLLGPQAHDLDGDGHLDAWFGFEPFFNAVGPQANAPGEDRAGLAVWWGNPNGLSGAPSVWVDARDADAPTGLLTAAKVDGAPGLTLVSWRDEQLTPRTFEGRNQAVDPYGVSVHTEGIEAVPASQLVSLDANGDGLDDLVQGDGTTLQLSVQLACTAADLAEGLCPLGVR
jgi:hypothetical protein